MLFGPDELFFEEDPITQALHQVKQGAVQDATRVQQRAGSSKPNTEPKGIVGVSPDTRWPGERFVDWVGEKIGEAIPAESKIRQAMNFASESFGIQDVSPAGLMPFGPKGAHKFMLARRDWPVYATNKLDDIDRSVFTNPKRHGSGESFSRDRVLKKLTRNAKELEGLRGKGVSDSELVRRLQELAARRATQGGGRMYEPPAKYGESVRENMGRRITGLKEPGQKQVQKLLEKVNEIEGTFIDTPGMGRGYKTVDEFAALTEAERNIIFDLIDEISVELRTRNPIVPIVRPY